MSSLYKPKMSLMRKSSDTRKRSLQEVNGNGSIGKTCNKKPLPHILLLPLSGIPPPPNFPKPGNPPPPPPPTSIPEIPPPPALPKSGIPPPPPPRDSENQPPPTSLKSVHPLPAALPKSGIPPPPPPRISVILPPPNSQKPGNPTFPSSLKSVIQPPPPPISGSLDARNKQSQQFFVLVPHRTAGEKTWSHNENSEYRYFTTLLPGTVPPGYPGIVSVLPPHPGSNDPLTAAMEKFAARTSNSSGCGHRKEHDAFGNGTLDISRKPSNPNYRIPFEKSRSDYFSRKLQCFSRYKFSNNYNRKNRRNEDSYRYTPYQRSPFSQQRPPLSYRPQFKRMENFVRKNTTPFSPETSEFRNAVFEKENALEQKEEKNQNEGSSRTNHIYSIEFEKIFTRKLGSMYREETLSLEPNENETEELNRMTVLKFFMYHLLKDNLSWFEKEKGAGKDGHIYFDGLKTIRVKGGSFKGKRGAYDVSFKRSDFTKASLEALKMVLKQDFQSVKMKFSVTKTEVKPEEQETRLVESMQNEFSEKLSISDLKKRIKKQRRATKQ